MVYWRYRSKINFGDGGKNNDSNKVILKYIGKNLKIYCVK